MVLRASTRRPGNCDSLLTRLSVMPSLRYSACRSALPLSKVITASDSIDGSDLGILAMDNRRSATRAIEDTARANLVRLGHANREPKREEPNAVSAQWATIAGSSAGRLCSA